MKIALIGSAPSSVLLAPYNDETWAIWGCSPGAQPSVARADAWFELHRREGSSTFPPEYLEWMKAQTCPIYMIGPDPEIPSSVAYPKAEMIEKYGRYFFTSSLAWMLALALSQEGVTDIGLWGVDMSATEEYGYQRAGCHYFIELARKQGVAIHAPPESDLLQPAPLYGLGEMHPMRIKLTTRQKELTEKMHAAAKRGDDLKLQFEQAIRESLYFQGAAEDVQYILNTWCE